MSFVLRRTEEINVEDLTGQLADNPRQTARLIVTGARDGDLEAQALLGQILLDGHGIEQDVGLALTWFGIAAERGHAMARNMLGRCLEHGWGCAKDEAGDFRGQFSHASVLAERGDLPAARVWLERALEGGNLNFLRVARQQLAASMPPSLRELTLAYFQRAAELGDESDLRHLAEQMGVA